MISSKIKTVFSYESYAPALARKLYTSARIYELKLGMGEWKLPIARPTGRVDFWGVRNCFLLEKKQELTSASYIFQK